MAENQDQAKAYPKSCKEVVELLQPQLDRVMTALQTLTGTVGAFRAKLGNDETVSLDGIANMLKDVTASITHANARVDEVVQKTIPTVVDHVAQVQEAHVLKSLDTDVWLRKVNVMVFGIPGDAGEEREETEAKVLDFAKLQLGVDTEPAAVAAVHRLSRTDKDAGIIIRFVRFSEAEKWCTAAARNGQKLKDAQPKRISVVQDVPPVLREIRSELLRKRATMLRDNPGVKISLRHVPQWPYLQLVSQERRGPVAGQPPPRREVICHDWSKAYVAAKYIGVGSIRCTAVKTVEEIGVQLAAPGFRPGAVGGAAAT